MPDRHPSDKSSLPLVYEDYCLLMAWMDAHWTRSNDPGGAFQKAAEDFQRACERERRGFNNDAVTAYQKRLKSKGLPQWLLKPAGYMALGKSDVLTVTLLDDIDLPQWIMAQAGRTIEEATLAFCFKPEPFVKRHRLLRNHLMSAQVLHQEMLRQSPTSARPLLVMVRLKLEGLPLLLDPVTVQGSVLDVACERMATAWQALQKQGPCTLFSSSDLQDDAWRVTLLDLQEEEEIGLLFTCRNLSLSAVLLGALRGLTLGGMKAGCPKFRALMKHIGEPFLRDAVNKIPTGDRLGPRAADDCHVFRWSRTSVALQLGAYQALATGKRKPRLSGLAASVTAAQVPAGHNKEAARLARKSLPKKVTGTRFGEERWRACMLGNVDMLVGSAVTSGFEGERWLPVERYVPLAEIFLGLHRLCSGLKEAPGRSRNRHISGWASALIVPMPDDLKDDRGKPLDSNSQSVPSSHKPFIGRLIEELAKGLFPNNSWQGDNDVERLRDAMQLSGLPVTLRRAFMVLFEKYVSLAKHPMRYDAVLDIYDSVQTLWQVLTRHLPELLQPVRNRPQQALVPRLSTGSVQFLFDFASAVESSIELRLRRSFPDGPAQEWDLDFRGPMSQVVIAGETVLRSALGIVRRTVLGEKDSFRRLGVVNRMSVSGGIYHVIGGIGFEEHARITYVDTDVAHLTHLTQLADYFHEAFHLIHEEMILSVSARSVARKSVPRATISLSAQVHLAQGIRGSISNQVTSPRDAGLTDLVDEYTAETFVAMMMFLTVAGLDLDMLWAHQGVTFASSPASAWQPPGHQLEAEKQNRHSLHENFAKAFIPLGMLTALIEPVLKQPRGRLDVLAPFCTMHEQGRLLQPMPLGQARAIFVERCKQISRLLPEDFPVKVHDLPVAAGPNYWHPDVLQEFDRVWSHFTVHELLPTLWQKAMEVFTCFAADVAAIAPVKRRGPMVGTSAFQQRFQGLMPAWRKETKRIDRLLKSAQDQHSPVAVGQIFSRWFEDCRRSGPQDEPPPVAGTLFVMRALHWAWSRYLPRPADAGKLWCLPRKVVWTKAGKAKVKIDFDPNRADDYADYLVDSIRPDGFCVRPEKRAQRLRDQAIFMKSLWGIAAVIRRRRLMAMINEHQSRMCPPLPKSSKTKRS